jgi:hypothetical protein
MLPLIPTFVYGGETETIICCDYTSYSTEKGKHKVKDKFVLIFLVDRTENTAYIIRNQGSAEVTFIPSAFGGITFIEVTEFGNVMTTTIDAKRDSVHSRNTILDGGIVSTQYYGKCVFK